MRKYRNCDILEKEERLMKFLKRKLLNKYKNKTGYWVINTRPKELKYLWVAKATGMTYKQVRSLFDKFIENGILEKFKAWDTLNHRKNFYRLRLVE